MDDDPRLFEVFLEVQRGLPRQGPGCRDGTLRALALCRDLPDRPSVLDVGCGPGLQTLVLAEALGTSIAALDLFPAYLAQLRSSAEAAGRDVHVVAGDMAALPFMPASVDLLWSEGAAYIMGIEAALSAWRPLLGPGGFVALSELVWLEPDPPPEAAAFFAEEYPAMTDVEANAAALTRCGYELLGHFTLPDAAWWDDYYRPLEAKLPALRETFAGDAEALEIVETTAREIDLRRRHGASYGYQFYVGRRLT